VSDMTAPDRQWNVANKDGVVKTWNGVLCAVLMDIRRELKRLNVAIYCPNFLAIPANLQKIERNTRNTRKTKRTKKRTSR